MGPLDTNESTKEYQIHFGSDLTLIRLTAGGNEYRGVVTAKTKKGTQVPVLVTVYADRTGSMVYQIGSALEPSADAVGRRTAQEMLFAVLAEVSRSPDS